MGTKLYIGNLSHTARETDLETLFHRAGVVMSVAIPTNAKTGYRKDYGFVNMGTEQGAQAAIQTLDGSFLIDQQISVREAGPQDRP